MVFALLVVDWWVSEWHGKWCMRIRVAKCMVRIDFLDDVKCSSSLSCELYGSYHRCVCYSSKTLVSVKWIELCNVLWFFVHPIPISSWEMSRSHLIDSWMAVFASFCWMMMITESVYSIVLVKHPLRDPNPRRLKLFKAISNCKKFPTCISWILCRVGILQ